MIALPVPAHATSSKDSPAIIAPGAMANEEWPSLGGSPADVGGDGDDWEMLSPTDNAINGKCIGEDMVFIPQPHTLMRKNSASAPDLRELDNTTDEDQDISILNHEDAHTEVSSSVVMVSGPASVAGSSMVVVSSNPYGARNKLSFRDAILAPGKHSVPAAGSGPQPRVKNKVKSRYVVTPIKRCAKSTGDLLALDSDDEEPLGETDAMEYYNRKAHGEHGRTNGLKQRPDEAKRKQMIVEKKNQQRQKQGQ